MNGRPVLVWVIAAVLVGCHADKKGLVGTWVCTATDQGANTTLTLNADHTLSMIATNGPKQAKYKLTGLGTWATTGDGFSMTLAKLDLSDVTDQQRKDLDPFIKREVGLTQDGPISWKGDDEFVLEKSGVKQDFKRQP